MDLYAGQPASPWQNLPVDIVREILEEIAHSSVDHALSCIVLSKATKTWIEPILYHTVFLIFPTKDRSWQYREECAIRLEFALRAKGPVFCQRYIKRIYFHGVTAQSIDTALRIVQLCRSIEFLHIGRNLNPIKRTGIENPGRNMHFGDLSNEASPPLFNNLTSVSLRDLNLKSIAALPQRLTHVALYAAPAIRYNPSILAALYNGCPHLDTVVLDYQSYPVLLHDTHFHPVVLLLDMGKDNGKRLRRVIVKRSAFLAWSLRALPRNDERLVVVAGAFLDDSPEVLLSSDSDSDSDSFLDEDQLIGRDNGRKFMIPKGLLTVVDDELAFASNEAVWMRRQWNSGLLLWDRVEAYISLQHADSNK